MSFPTYVDLNYGMERLTSSTEAFPVGVRGVMPDGRAYRYCKADSDLPTKYGAANADFLHFMNTAVEGTAGDTDLTVVIDAAETAYAKDRFKGGFVTIHGTIVQTCLKIESSDASDGTNVKLNLAEPLLYTTPLPTFVEVHANKYYGVTHPNDAGYETMVVVPPVVVTSGQYFWGQTWGECLCTAAVGGGMGATVNQRAVYFQDDGGIGGGDDLAVQFQYAGYVIPWTWRDGSAADSIHFELQLAP